ncbi:hypothetical protein OIU84_012729 [Salix udensis]|uniref:XPG-I domain-containing protein n=1 Tax=Salix udensis TaxID=889485 RepID=A0AAD6NTZ6_9ROSI|nr:hypothetical protein OIU84_012729 [Salix udensis]
MDPFPSTSSCLTFFRTINLCYKFGVFLVFVVDEAPSPMKSQPRGVELLELFAGSDAFLFGAKLVIKCLKPNTKEPFECYHLSYIEAGLGLEREHLIAISLLVGNDHYSNGMKGVGLEKARHCPAVPMKIWSSLVVAFSEEVERFLHEKESPSTRYLKCLRLMA